MQIEDGIKLDYSDVLIRPKRSTLNSRSEVNLERTLNFKAIRTDMARNHADDPRWLKDVKSLKERLWNGVPLIASNMDGVGTFHMAERLAEQKVMTIITKSHTVEEWRFRKEWVGQNENYVAVSIGTGAEDYKKLTEILHHCPILKFICIDIANGYSEGFVDYCKKIRNEFTDKVIIAGNVATREMTEELVLNGVDIVKVGIGPGSVCTTRSQTGVGYPQLSAVDECADAAHGLGGRIIADGGCTSPGDVSKAFGAGADFVMLGGMLAGCDEGGGEIIMKDGREHIKFYGMSSKEAQEKHSGGLKGYRSSEGKCVKIPYKGKVTDVLQNILGGVRSTCTYVGARNLKELDRCITFIRVNNQTNKVYDNG